MGQLQLLSLAAIITASVITEAAAQRLHCCSWQVGTRESRSLSWASGAPYSRLRSNACCRALIARLFFLDIFGRAPLGRDTNPAHGNVVQQGILIIALWMIQISGSWRGQSGFRTWGYSTAGCRCLSLLLTLAHRYWPPFYRRVFLH